VKNASTPYCVLMGQYYYPIILAENGKIIICMSPYDYNNGSKLTEHSYLNNSFVHTFEFGLSPEGIYHKSRVVWAGDYADPEEDGVALYNRCDEYNTIRPDPKVNKYRFLVNHTKKQFVDKEKIPKSEHGYTFHPLPLLTAEGNGRGGGDYTPHHPLIGSWARDVLSVEEIAPPFEELVFDLT